MPEMKKIDMPVSPEADAKRAFEAMTLCITKLTGSVNILISKLEDQMAAMDDHRSVMDEMSESMNEAAGYMGSALQILDDVSSVGKDGEVKWSDVNAAIGRIKDANEAGNAEDEEEERE